MRSYLAKAHIPDTHEALSAHLQSSGFKIIRDDQIRDQVSFRSYSDVETWALDSGWAASYFENFPIFKLWLARTVFGAAKILWRPFYPLDGTTDISVILARKN